MTPPNTGAEEMVMGAEQLEHSEIIAAKYAIFDTNDAGAPELVSPMLVMRFALDAEDRRRLLAGEDLYVGVLTYGHPLQPFEPRIGAGDWQLSEPLPQIEQARTALLGLDGKPLTASPDLRVYGGARGGSKTEALRQKADEARDDR